MFIINPHVLDPVVTPTTYWLDAATGSDLDDGLSEANAFATLAFAASQLASGDILLVKDGTYTAAWASGDPAPGFSWEFPTIIQAAPGHSPVINAVAGNHAVLFIGTHHVVLRGFEIDGTGGLDGIKITWGTGSYQSHHIRIQECDIHSFTNQGINGGSAAAGEADGCEILSNLIHDGGEDANLDHGVYFSAPDLLIDGNEIYNCAAYGVHIFNDAEERAFNNIIRGNFVHDNAVLGSGQGILLGDGGGHLCYNNIVAGNSGGIRAEFASSGSVIFNNTVYDNNRGGAKTGIEVDGVPDCEVKNNIVWGHTTTVAVLNTTADVSDNLTTDPGFIVDPPVVAGDFRVNVGSAAINAGATLNEVIGSYTGILRPQWDGFDIGAYETPWKEFGSGSNIDFEGGALVFEMGNGAMQYIERPITLESELWIQFSITVPSDITHFEEAIFGIRVPGQTFDGYQVVRCDLWISSSFTRFRIGTRNDALSGMNVSTSSISNVYPQTLLIDLHWIRATGPGNNDGELEIYIDGAGTPAAEIINLDNDGQDGATFLWIGTGTSLRTHTVYDLTFDGLKVGTTRGGLDIFAEDF